MILLDAYLHPENGHADVFIPISIQTERPGNYTNFDGVVSRVRAVLAKKARRCRRRDAVRRARRAGGGVA